MILKKLRIWLDYKHREALFKKHAKNGVLQQGLKESLKLQQEADSLQKLLKSSKQP